MAHASAADMLKRYDARTIGDLVSDVGSRVTSASLLSDPNLAAALDDASGEIDASVKQGKRYSTAQLTALTGNSLAYLKRITCALAIGLLWERRPYNDGDENTVAEQAAESGRRAVAALRRGEQVFDVEELQEAGLPHCTTPSRVTIENRNLAIDQARGHMYPHRILPGE